MNQKDKLEKDLGSLKEMVKAEIEKDWRDGFNAGSLNTCYVLYRTFQSVGLEETNMLFTILKDIAKNTGCEDLKKYVEDRKENK